MLHQRSPLKYPLHFYPYFITLTSYNQATILTRIVVQAKHIAFKTHIVSKGKYYKSQQKFIFQNQKSATLSGNRFYLFY